MVKGFREEIEIGGRKLILESGELALHANAAVKATFGETVVLATVCNQKTTEEISYLPLTVDYEERLYAGGRISTSRFIKREGRPTESAILTARMIDRSIRPLFSKTLRDEIQVIVTVLSVDQENDPDVLSAIAVSAALALSSIPWAGPIGAVRVGQLDNHFVVNPTNAQREQSPLDLVVASTQELPVMIEAGARSVSEEVMMEAIKFAQRENEKIIEFINGLSRQFAKEKEPIPEPPTLSPEEKKLATDFIHQNLLPTLSDPQVAADEKWFDKALDQLAQALADHELNQTLLANLLESEVRNYVRRQILDSGKRLDGRFPDQLRDLKIEVGILPRTHGSALFQRGETQVLSIVTLGSPALEQLIESMEGEETKRYMHHYNFPPFSTGEVRRIGPLGRREIGHGASRKGIGASYT